MPTDTEKTIAGALLTGAGLLSGNAIMLTVAGGIGVNWSAEGLAGLWQQARAAFHPGTALSRAGERAIRRAVNDLRTVYRTEAGPEADTRAFDLVRDCAGAVVVAHYPDPTGDPVTAQQALAPALAALLHGHTEQSVTFLQRRLLEAVTVAFRNELAADEEAWRLFHGWLLEHLATRTAAQTAALQPALDQLTEVPAYLADQRRSAEALDAAAAQMTLLLDRLAAAIRQMEAGIAPAGVTFENVDLRAEGSINEAGGDIVQGGVIAPPPAPARPAGPPITFHNQRVSAGQDINLAGGNIYKDSAHVQGSGTGLVINNPHLPPTRPPGQPEPDLDQAQPLTLRFTPTTDGADVRWEAAIIGTVQSNLVTPYPGADLPLVITALDAAQHPGHPAQGPAFSPAERERLAALGLWQGDQVVPAIHQRVGQALYGALTADPAGAQALSTIRNSATSAARPLDIILRFAPAALSLAALPWELLWDAQQPLLLSRGKPAACVRYLDLDQALPPPRTAGRPLRILAIGPHAGIPDAICQEERAARHAAFAALVAAGTLVVEELHPATLTALVDHIHQGPPPDILHFYGHGRYQDDTGALLFDTPGGGQTWVDATRLAALLGEVRLVVLHACQSAMIGEAGLLTGIAPALSAAGVPAVIAMQLTVRVAAATRFAGVVYRELAREASVQRAVSLARQALYVEEDDGASWYVPTLTLRTRDQKALHLIA